MFAIESYHAASHAPRYMGSTYINELSDLYSQYFVDRDTKKLLRRRIEELNSAIKDYVENREITSYILFCESNHNRALAHATALKEKCEFFHKALSIVYHTSTDSDLNTLLYSSMKVLEEFIIKLIDYSDIIRSLNVAEPKPDENSEEYNNKMAEVVEVVLKQNKRKFGNSIRESLGL